MKWFSMTTYRKHQEDIKAYNTGIGRYYEWVIKLANSKPKEYSAIGILDTNDLIQAGHLGLIEAWQKIEWDRIEASKNPEAELWSFLKRRIKGSIQREVDTYGAHIKVPRRDIEKARASLTNVDRTFVNLFPQFFDEAFANMVEEMTPWDQVQLGELLDDIFLEYIPNANHAMILRLCFGIDTPDDKAWSMKAIAEKYGISVSNVQNIKHRALKKLNNEEVSKIIENFYQN